ncbi:competence protein CoiA [Sporosarcina koreensis]|uniref:competence protein CoiA n=1 Tax=Sporosarcina koreensis TaxID=334735 RepID=UPI0015CF5B9A|nr:competence protein CoiA family protein [Sporosarcina koreensis]
MIHILTATTEDGTPVVLDTSLSRDMLTAWKTSGRFQCPQCKEPVLLKAGTVRIPHFAHRPGSDCQSRFSEGESAAHLSGKQLLYGLFRRLGKQPVLEPLLTELAQRPDLLIIHGNDTIPIEFQCSRIPPDLKDSRSAGYRSVGMTPIWLLRTPETSEGRAEGVDLYSFSSFHQQFITTSLSPGASLLTLSPNTSAFHYFTHFLHIEGNRYLCGHRKLPVHLQTFPFARPKPPSAETAARYSYLYRKHRKAFLQRSLFISRKGVQDPFLRNCYRMKTAPSAMPWHIGVPVTGNSSFAVHDCVWQLDLTVSMKNWRLPPASIPLRYLRQFTARYSGSQEAQLDACRNYLKFLRRIRQPDKTLLPEKEAEKEIIQLIADGFLANQIEN